MSLELVESATNGTDSGRDTLYMLGGVAMIVFGAGLILANPSIRRYMANLGVGNITQAMLPDVERYFKLRAM